MKGLVFFVTFLISVCSQAQMEFGSEELSQYLNYNPLSPTGMGFVSQIDNKSIVQIYFNDIAQPTYDGSGAIAFAVGSVMVRAVVDTVLSPLSTSQQLFFSKKMPDGYDPDNGNWAYARASLVNGKLAFTSMGHLDACIECHQDQSTVDFSYTVTPFRMHQVE